MIMGNEEHHNQKNEIVRKVRQRGGPVPKITTMTVRMTTTERRIITNKALQAGMCTSEWIRHSSRKAVVRKRLCKETVAHLRMMSGMANQLHQLKQLAESSGLYAIMVELRTLLSRLELTMERMVKDDR